MPEKTNLELYELTKQDPSKVNIQIFLNEHRPYINKICNTVLSSLSDEDKKEAASEVILTLIKRGRLDFKRDYKELLGYIALSTQRICIKYYTEKPYRYMQQELQILDVDEHNGEDLNMYDVIACQLYNEARSNKAKELLDEILYYATDKEEEVIRAYLMGFTYDEVAISCNWSRQYVQQIMRSFGARLKGIYRKQKQMLK